MNRRKATQQVEERAPARRGSQTSAPAGARIIPLHPPPAGLLALPALAFDEESGQVTLRGTTTITATLDQTLDRIVVKGAVARGERLIVQHEGGGYVVLGALRTA